MSVWESSEQPGVHLPTTPEVDRHLPDNRPADGAQNGVTNRGASRSVQTRVVIKDGRICWIDSTGRYVATFSVIPELDTTIPVEIIAKPGYDVYTDILGIARPF